MKKIIGFYNKSVWMTYLGVCFAITGMYFCIAGQFNLAMVMLIWSGICDMFDGMIARKVKRTEQEKEFGVEIDSLADVINFLALPAVFFLTSEYFTPIFLPIVMLYVLTGIIRLGYFNVVTSKSTEATKSYTGLPVTFAALLFPIFYLVFDNQMLLITYLVISILFVLNFKISKPGLSAYVFLFALAIIMSVVLVVV